MDSSDDVAEVQCTEDGGIITTTLHITSELNGTSEDFSVRCTIINSAPVTVATRTIMIAGKNEGATSVQYRFELGNYFA